MADEKVHGEAQLPDTTPDTVTAAAVKKDEADVEKEAESAEPVEDSKPDRAAAQVGSAAAMPNANGTVTAAKGDVAEPKANVNEGKARGRGRADDRANKRKEAQARLSDHQQPKKARTGGSDAAAKGAVGTGVRSNGQQGIVGLHPSHGMTGGTVLTYGMGENDQLGYEAAERQKPKVVPDLPAGGIVQVCCGGLHTACVASNGKVYTFGVNDEGALGRSGAEGSVLPMEGEVALKKAVQVACGDSHTVVLCDDGTVYGSGIYRDGNGKLGFSSSHGKGVVVTTAERIVESVSTFRNPVVRIVSGVDHTLALTANGRVFSWGCGEQGRLGRVAERTSKRRKMDILLQTGLVKIRPPTHGTPESRRVVDVACGAYHSFALTEDGSLYAWGASMCGQTGLHGATNYHFPEKVTLLEGKKIVAVAAGNHHSLALDTEGRVWSTGKGTGGVLGTGDETHSLQGEDEEADNRWFEVKGELQGKHVHAVACGSECSFALTEDNELYAWGFGDNLQLGTGSEESCLSPVLVTGSALSSHTVLQVSAGGQHVGLLATP